jgi:hypothetical protein
MVLSVVIAVLGIRAAEGGTTPVPTAAVAMPGESGSTGTAASSTPVPTTTPTSTTVTPPTTPTTIARVVPTTVAVVRTTVAPPVREAPAPVAPVAAAAPVAAPPAPSASTAERCAAARQWVEAHGLVLPAGYGFRCPGPAMQGETPRWGITCWNCAGAGSYIAVDIDRIGPSDATLRYVVAHETCHANDFATLGVSTEIGADLCAALHGAPRP